MPDAIAYKLLIVEDDAATRTLLEYNLSGAGFTVFMAENGHHALEVLAEDSIDLIVSDIMMPGMDGYMFREQVILDPGTRSIPFVFLTAKAQGEDQIKGLRSGVDDYITKPFEPLVMIARVQAVLERRRVHDEMTRHDGLTGLLNRVTFEREVTRELKRVVRYDTLGSFVFMDLDNFKQINDTYGHAAGDLLLSNVAQLMIWESRAVDLLGRYGGEEFVVYFPETNADQAASTMLRILKKLQSRGLGREKFQASFSAGVAEAPRHGRDLSVLCAEADKAMYEAKRQGKARVVLCSSDDNEGPAQDTVD
jgi:diguanylate cyclase (GGDEF)-like protein